MTDDHIDANREPEDIRTDLKRAGEELHIMRKWPLMCHINPQAYRGQMGKITRLRLALGVAEIARSFSRVKVDLGRVQAALTRFSKATARIRVNHHGEFRMGRPGVLLMPPHETGGKRPLGLRKSR